MTQMLKSSVAKFIYPLVAIILITLSCKQRADHSQVSEAVDMQTDDGIVILPCTDEICGPNGEKLLVVGQDPNDQSFVADMNDLDKYQGYAAVEGENKPKMSRTEKSFEQSAHLNEIGKNVLAQAATQYAMTSLVRSMSPMLNQVQKTAVLYQQVSTFAATNIEAKDESERKRALDLLKELSNELNGDSPQRDATTAKILANLEIFAGQDGWLNFGDQFRLTAPITQIATNIADKRIAQTYSTQLYAAQQQARQDYLPLGGRFPIIGPILASGVDRKVAEAAPYVAAQRKTQAVNQAGANFQGEYVRLLSQLGVTSWYLGGANVDKNRNAMVADPAPGVSQPLMVSTIEMLYGKSWAELEPIFENAARNNQPLIPPKIWNAVPKYAAKVILPDGIPIAEIQRLELFSAAHPDETALPTGLIFKLVKDAKGVERLEIRQNKKGSFAEISTEIDQKNNDFECLGITQRAKDGIFKLFLYSREKGRQLSLATNSEWFTATGLVNPMNGWPLIRYAIVSELWEKSTVIRIKIQREDGTEGYCKSKLLHYPPEK